MFYVILTCHVLLVQSHSCSQKHECQGDPCKTSLTGQLCITNHVDEIIDHETPNPMISSKSSTSSNLINTLNFKCFCPGDYRFDDKTQKCTPFGYQLVSAQSSKLEIQIPLFLGLTTVCGLLFWLIYDILRITNKKVPQKKNLSRSHAMRHYSVNRRDEMTLAREGLAQMPSTLVQQGSIDSRFQYIDDRFLTPVSSISRRLGPYMTHTKSSDAVLIKNIDNCKNSDTKSSNQNLYRAHDYGTIASSHYDNI